MEWLLQQAQQASPFIATFCLVAFLGACKVAKVLWDQLMFERDEHRKAELAQAEVAKEIAVSHEAMAQSMDQLTTTLNGVLPALLHIATTRAAAE